MQNSSKGCKPNRKGKVGVCVCLYLQKEKRIINFNLKKYINIFIIIIFILNNPLNLTSNYKYK